MDCMDFDLLPLLSYLACRSRIILQVTFAILLDGQSKVASVQLNPGWAATNWYCSILRDLTDQWISRRCQASQTYRYTNLNWTKNIKISNWIQNKIFITPLPHMHYQHSIELNGFTTICKNSWGYPENFLHPDFFIILSALVCDYWLCFFMRFPAFWNKWQNQQDGSPSGECLNTNLCTLLKSGRQCKICHQLELIQSTVIFGSLHLTSKFANFGGARGNQFEELYTACGCTVCAATALYFKRGSPLITFLTFPKYFAKSHVRPRK